jgi:hypothetical protein
MGLAADVSSRETIGVTEKGLQGVILTALLGMHYLVYFSSVFRPTGLLQQVAALRQS